METKHTNLILHDYQKKSFYHALRTKGFVILGGLSGTGKTKIFEEFGSNFIKIRNSIENLLTLLNGIIDDKRDLNERLELWKEFSLILDTPAYRHEFSNLNLDVFLKILLDELNISKTDLCLHYLFLDRKYKKRDTINDHDEEIGIDEAKEKLQKDIIPVLKEIRYGKGIDDYILYKAFSKKVKYFIWSLYHPESFLEYSGNENDIIKIIKNYVSEKYFVIAKLKKLFLPVRPDFKDSKSLLGYYNPLKGKYQKTELLEFILEAQREYIQFGKSALPYLVLLDEMNLARVEYYFADFLSVLESKRIENESDIDDEMLKNIKDENNNPVSEKDKLIGFYSKPIILHNEDLPDVPQKLYLPPNLYFIGSVNIDETTYMFSPKVLDRAFTIEFDADLEMYLKEISNQNKTVSQEDIKLSDFTRKGKFAVIEQEYVDYMAKKKIQKLGKSYGDILNEIFSILKPYGLHFGYRVFNEIMMFLYNATKDTNANYKMDEIEALDLAIKMKILPKFHGTRQKLENPIKKLIKYCERADKDFAESDNQPDYLSPKKIPNLIKESNTNRFKLELDDREFLFPHTACKLIEMLYKLQTQGFASFL